MNIAGSRHFSKLVQDYLTRFDDSPIRDFFAWPPLSRGTAIQALAKELVQRASGEAGQKQRSVIVEAIRKQHEKAGILDSAVEKNLKLLAKPTTVAVVTGQQVGILGGPLYTIYKAFSAIAYANELHKELSEYDVVPIFWQETEDHDLEEATHYGILDTTGRYSEHSYEYSEQVQRSQVGDLPLDEAAIHSFFYKLRDSLAFTEFTILKECKQWYTAGTTFAEAQARLLGALTEDTGLLILNANTRAIKSMCAGLFHKELTTSPRLQEIVRGQSQQLAATYHTQLDPSPVNLFILDENKRFKLEKDNNGFRYDAKQISTDDILKIIDNEPERISPNVVMRPLFQDSILPTIAYVAGPGEIAYYAQLKTAYEWAGIPMPIILPRFSATIVEERVRKNIEKAGGTIADLIENGEKVITDLTSSDEEVTIARIFEAAEKKIEAEVETIRPTTIAADGSLDGALTNVKGKILTLIKDLGSKTVAAERKKASTIRTQLQRSLSSLLPEDTLQERKIGLLYFANKYGPGFTKGLKDRILSASSTSEHFLIDVNELVKHAELPPDKTR